MVYLLYDTCNWKAKKTYAVESRNNIFRNAFIDKHMEYVTIIYFLQQKKE